MKHPGQTLNEALAKPWRGMGKTMTQLEYVVGAIQDGVPLVVLFHESERKSQLDHQQRIGPLLDRFGIENWRYSGYRREFLIGENQRIILATNSTDPKKFMGYHRGICMVDHSVELTDTHAKVARYLTMEPFAWCKS